MEPRVSMKWSLDDDVSWVQGYGLLKCDDDGARLRGSGEKNEQGTLLTKCHNHTPLKSFLCLYIVRKK